MLSYKRKMTMKFKLSKILKILIKRRGDRERVSLRDQTAIFQIFEDYTVFVM